MRWLADLFSPARPPAIADAMPRDAAAIADLHAASFRRGWSEDEIERMLTDRSVIAHRATIGKNFAGFIISRVFGPDYEGAIEIFRWAVWLSVPAGIEAIGNLVVLKYQAKFVLLGKWLLALAVAFAVNSFAIPHMGSYGALAGLAAGYLAAAAVNFYYIRFRVRA